MSFFINNSQIEYILEDNIVHKKKEKKKQSMSKKKKKTLGRVKTPEYKLICGSNDIPSHVISRNKLKVVLFY